MTSKQKNETESSSKSSRRPVVNPKQFFPTESCSDMKKKFHASRAWKAFADIYQNGIYWKPVLYEKQGGICPVCGKLLSSTDVICASSIHHLRYSHTCNMCSDNDLILVPYITSDLEKPAFKKVPNCAVCRYKSPESYSKCRSFLLLFHRECHCIVHDKL